MSLYAPLMYSSSRFRINCGTAMLLAGQQVRTATFPGFVRGYQQGWVVSMWGDRCFCIRVRVRRPACLPTCLPTCPPARAPSCLPGRSLAVAVSMAVPESALAGVVGGSDKRRRQEQINAIVPYSRVRECVKCTHASEHLHFTPGVLEV